MKKAGTTWWGQQWIAALVGVLAGDEGRLSRGRTYARAGRTHDLTVDGGKVRAKVTGSRPRPYEIQIELRRLDDAAWTRAIAGLAAKAEFAATLLGGAMPERIDDVFRAAGAGLFPASRAELSTSCSCPDWATPANTSRPPTTSSGKRSTAIRSSSSSCAAGARPTSSKRCAGRAAARRNRPRRRRRSPR
jgi:uncharacterized Zn finger protein